MITYIVTRGHSYTILPYFSLYRKQFAPCPQVLVYDQLTARSTFQPGTYIFADIERLSPREAEQAGKIHNLLAQAGNHVRVFNHPTQSMRRYQLLRTLYEAQINAFNVYAITEQRRPQAFPVFIRGRDDHGGAITPLLWTQSDLEVAIEFLLARGVSLEDKLIVEFCDTSDETGTTRKYGAYVIGDAIIPCHILFSHSWMVKGSAAATLSPALVAEETHYLAANPHEAALRAICQRAKIRYGRIDYGLRDGAIQVWEINTNPSLPLNKNPRIGGYTRAIQVANARYNAALAAIDMPESGETLLNPYCERTWMRMARPTMRLLPPRYIPGIRKMARIAMHMKARMMKA